MSGLYDLIQGEAELGDESDDESFDEETGELRKKLNGARRRNENLDDSSEEESDDDEEAARAVSSSLSYTYNGRSIANQSAANNLDTRRLHCRGRRRARGARPTKKGEKETQKRGERGGRSRFR